MVEAVILKNAVNKFKKSANKILRDIAKRVHSEKQTIPTHYSKMHHRHSRR